ncbi:MAG: YceD family protein [Nannocystaceae bacterium]
MKEQRSVLESLRVDLAALRRRGVDHHPIDAVLPVDWLARVLSDTDAEVTTEGRITLNLLLQPAGIVVAQGTLTVHFEVPCGRCLSPAKVDGGTEVFATFMPGTDDEAPEDDDDAALDPDEDSADVWRYRGSLLHLDGLVAEQVALGYPMRALCERGEDCRGLCSNCGHELNGLAPEVLRCPQCHNEVALTPVGDLPDPEGAERLDNPLAAALSKIVLK